MKEPAVQMSGSRRTFLKVAVAAGGASALTTVGASPAHSVIRKTNVPPVTPDEGSTGYHETAHVQDYYKTLRE